MKEIINNNDLNNLKKILTLIDSKHSTFSESWNHLEHYEGLLQKRKEKSLQKKTLEKKK